MKKIFLFILILSTSVAKATPASKLNEDGSFRVSDKSLHQLGIKFYELQGKRPWVLPKEAIVQVKFTKGVYRRYEGDVTFVIVKILKKDGEYVSIVSQDLEPGDEVAVKGASFLRLAEADLNSDTVDACAH
jgi:multidrug efflux pump subunit AcrA (membrane-fusion protein)